MPVVDPFSASGSAAPPVISGVTPAPGSAIAATDALGFTVNDSVGLRALLVWAQLGDGVWEMVHDGTAFAPTYAVGSTRTEVVAGKQYAYSIQRNGSGWFKAPTLRIEAVDLQGAEA